MAATTSWVPTRKWFATAVVLIAGVLTSGVESGFDDAELNMAIGVAVTLATAYLLPNRNGDEGEETGLPHAAAAAGSRTTNPPEPAQPDPAYRTRGQRKTDL